MDMNKISFSGIQPSNIPTIGNYLGAIRNWVKMSGEYRGIYCIVDMHAITVRQDPALLRERTRTLYAILLSAGIDLTSSVLFVQSQVPAHAELSWILGSFTMFGELSRMTQFKDKSSRNAENINAALFTYPALMAADILLYNTDVVPVGDDQKQHVELARDIAIRFNGIYGDLFTIPETLTPPVGARIMSLIEPSRKMDKSDPNPAAYISMLDDRDTVIKKCKRAVTDSEARVAYDTEQKPGVSNLMTIYSACTGKAFGEIEREFEGHGYGAFKEAVGEAADAVLSPIRRGTKEYLDSPARLDKLIHSEAERAKTLAEPCIKRVKESIGFIGTGK